MNSFLVGFVLGVSSCLYWPQIPSSYWTLPAILLALCLLKRCPFAAALLLGFAYWALYSQYVFHNSQLPDAGHFTITGEVKSLPQQRNHGVSLVFDLDGARAGKALAPIPLPVARGRVKLRWYGQHDLRLGERWRFRVRLKPIHGLANQGSFNYRRHLVANHIVRTGSILDGERLQATSSRRGLVVEALHVQTESLAMGPLLRALAVADKRGVSADHWQVLQRSGTGHLFAISGLHLGVVAGGCAALILWLLQWLRPGREWPNKRWASVLALAAALGYAYLAGFSLPTQRAWLMLLCATVMWLLHQRVALWEGMLWALAVVLLLDPLALLSPGLWLSFGAVAVIFAVIWRWPGQGLSRWRQLLVIQLVLFPGLLLVQGLWFGGISLIAPLVNLVLVPWVSLLVIPLVLLAVLTLSFAGISGGLLWLADTLLQWPWRVLEWLTAQELSWLPLSWHYLVPITLVSWLLAWGMLAPLIRWRWCALLLPLALLSWRSPPGWTLHFLDVGQGSALVVQRDNRGILVDTGNSFPGGFSMARQVILPFLRFHGIDHIDLVVLSHLDRDHAGGADFLLSRFAGTRGIASGDWSGKGTVEQCAALVGESLPWQGLSLSFLAPVTALAEDNDNSCVLRIDDGRFSALLPGDIELAGERALVARWGRTGRLRADLLLVPHHGSRSSSSPGLVSAVRPAHAVVSSGFDNRWGFPHPEVVARYEAVGARVHNLADSGQLSVSISPSGVTKIINYRQNIAPFWYNRQLSVGHPPDGYRIRASIFACLVQAEIPN